MEMSWRRRKENGAAAQGSRERVPRRWEGGGVRDEDVQATRLRHKTRDGLVAFQRVRRQAMIDSRRRLRRTHERDARERAAVHEERAGVRAARVK